MPIFCSGRRKGKMNVFGPVPSRRLGKSLGINNIPAKICTYSCVYCQIGRSLKMVGEREEYYSPQMLFAEIKDKVKRAREHNESIDYLTFVPDGEPTLDKSIGELIEMLKPLDIKVAVITNASLIDLPDVRDDLFKADWVSLKVDTVDEAIWRKIDRPHRKLRLDSILKGIKIFAGEFEGHLATETMLVRDLNDRMENIRDVAGFIKELNVSTAYIGVPTRPPAEKWVLPPEESALNTAYHIFVEDQIYVEYLIGYEGNQFAFTGDVEEDILSTTAVHPMREDALNALLEKADSDFSLVERLVAEGKIVVSEYGGNRYYLRRLTLKDADR